MFRTKITELFGIEYPIIAGGMLHLSTAELAAAVSNAGGLGVISSATFMNINSFREEIRKAKNSTDKPLAVNIPLLPSLRPLDIDGFIAAMADEGISIVETAGRSPEPYMPRFKKNGFKVMHKVTSVRFALKAQQVGCDAVIIDGCECAGHSGEEDLTSLVLIPIVADALDIPVIAAGGIGDGRGLVAAMSLGAEAVLMGTRFMMSLEAPMHNETKEYLKRMSESETTYILRTFRNTARVINNSVAEKVKELESRGVGIEKVLPLVRGIKEKELMETGNMDAGILHCGQIIGLIKDVSPVKQIFTDIIDEAIKIRKTMAL